MIATAPFLLTYPLVALLHFLRRIFQFQGKT